MTLSQTRKQRIAELTERPQLTPMERGELRAMAGFANDPEDRAAIERLLAQHQREER